MPAFVDLLTLLERLAERLGRPTALSTALVALACAHAAAVVSTSPAYDAVAAVLAVVCVASAFSLGGGVAVRGWGDARAQRRDLADSGWQREAVFPFFVEEIEGSQKVALIRARRPWRLVAVGLGLVLTVATVSSVALAAVLSGGIEGVVTLAPGERVEAFVAEHPADGTLHDLGLVAVLDKAERGDDGLWSVTLNVKRVRDATERSVSLRAGESRNIGGQQFALREVRPLPGIGAARVQLTPRAGGATTEVVLESREPVELSDGRTVTLLDGRMAYLGQLGPAAQIEERTPDGRVVRTEWVFTEAPGFDARHGAGELAIELLGVEPPVAVVLSVARTPFASWSPLWTAISLVGLVVLGVGLSARGARLDGRSGDFRFTTAGWSPPDPGRVATAYLTAAQQAELASLGARLKLASAESQETSQ
jgi:hypothetical protein